MVPSFAVHPFSTPFIFGGYVLLYQQNITFTSGGMSPPRWVWSLYSLQKGICTWWETLYCWSDSQITSWIHLQCSGSAVAIRVWKYGLFYKFYLNTIQTDQRDLFWIRYPVVTAQGTNIYLFIGLSQSRATRILTLCVFDKTNKNILDFFEESCLR